MSINSIQDLQDVVKFAGEIAINEQKKIGFTDRNYKNDGSIVTFVDKKVENFLFENVEKLYPETNILTEEAYHPINLTKPYTFAIDPIDGTEVFSMGMHGWCISIGLLDYRLMPIAGIIYSPSLEIFLFADVNKRAKFNNKEIYSLPLSDDPFSKSNLVVPSTIHKQADLRNYPGRIRSIGSAALHLCYPLIYPGFFGALESKGAHIWDIAGAHAINLSVGFDFEFIDGGKIDYSSLVDGKAVGRLILAGSQQRIALLRNSITILA
jgi:myo-inositol-1(or 4)-monophosphatase